MNKCMCASIMSLHRLKPCTINDIHCSILSSCTSQLPWFLHTNIRYRWLLFFVVMQYDLKEQIKFLWMSVSDCVSVSIKITI